MKAKKAPARKVAPRARAAEKSAPAKAVISPTDDEPANPTDDKPANPPGDKPAKATPAKRARKAAPLKAVPKPAEPETRAAETAPGKAAGTAPVTAAGTAPVKTEAAKAEAVETAAVKTEAVKTAAVKTDAVEAAAVKTEAVETEAVEVEAVEVKVGSTAAGRTTPALDQLTLDLLPHLLSNPRNAPKLLARTAVETLGPRAAAWAAHTRATYPSATPKALARLATAHFTRVAEQRGLLSALSGPYAPIALVATAALTHAELVLHLAAAYGLDPSDPERAAEILVLLPGYRGGAAWAALRLADRVLPGASLLGAVLGGRNAAESVAVRAERRYGWYFSQSSQESGSSS
ncbi:hypothetical protein SAMN06264365_108206 [Actinoplanes regularis]|uniref:EcsC protein family protein n=1 Tax=Actinoplanes regularis TaxID=52697 RepID=A0A239AYK5_9ACTN|nr:hypothetical protein SAMN06264365_108206 [Actinoplanes regularis]